MLRVGDKVFCPQYGECRIQAVFDQGLGNSQNPVFILKPDQAPVGVHRLVYTKEKMVQKGVKPVSPLVALALAVMVFPFFLSACASSDYAFSDTYRTAKHSYLQGDYPSAARSFREFTESNPHSPMTEVAMYYLGESYQKSGDIARATDAYQKLIGQYKTGPWVDWAEKNLKRIESMKAQ